jgi:hypothetical protein
VKIVPPERDLKTFQASSAVKDSTGASRRSNASVIRYSADCAERRAAESPRVV